MFLYLKYITFTAPTSANRHPKLPFRNYMFPLLGDPLKSRLCKLPCFATSICYCGTRLIKFEYLRRFLLQFSTLMTACKLK